MPANASAELARIAAELRATANGGLKRELTQGIRAAAQPLPNEVKAAAGRQLPQTGGLAARVAAERVTTSVILSGSRVGVRLKTSTHDSRATNAGYVRHPVYGRWIEDLPSQEIPQARGWWTDTLRRRSPEVVGGAVEAVIARVSAKLRAR